MGGGELCYLSLLELWYILNIFQQERPGLHVKVQLNWFIAKSSPITISSCLELVHGIQGGLDLTQIVST